MSNVPQTIQPPPVKTPFDDFSGVPDTAPDWFTKWIAGVKVSRPWLKWFQTIANLPEPAIVYTPVITAGAGAFTTVSATGRYRKIGKLVFIQLTITITTNGSAAGGVLATLPFASVNVAGVEHILAGRAAAVSGKMLQGRVIPNSSSLAIVDYSNVYPGADGETLVLSGFYEIA